MLTRKKIALQLRLRSDSDRVLNEEGSKTITLDGLRSELVVDANGTQLGQATLQLRAYGLSMDVMRLFRTLKRNPLENRGDVVAVLAGDDVVGMRKIFEGTILEAVPNMLGQPDVSLDIISSAAYFEQITPAAANSYRGSTDVAEICASIAKQMGFAFQNHGVSAKLSDPALNGSLIHQLSTVTHAARVPCTINNGTITIFPNDVGLSNEPFLISKETGLVGYPSVSRIGVECYTEFNPDIEAGQKVIIESGLPDTSGEWWVQTYRHELSSADPNGKFFTYMNLSDKGGFVGTF